MLHFCYGGNECCLRKKSIKYKKIPLIDVFFFFFYFALLFFLFCFRFLNFQVSFQRIGSFDSFHFSSLSAFLVFEALFLFFLSFSFFFFFSLKKQKGFFLS